MITQYLETFRYKGIVLIPREVVPLSDEDLNYAQMMANSFDSLGRKWVKPFDPFPKIDERWIGCDYKDPLKVLLETAFDTIASGLDPYGAFRIVTLRRNQPGYSIDDHDHHGISLIVFSLYLNEDYSGGDLFWFEENQIIYKNPNKGDLAPIGSRVMHGVTNVEKGDRLSALLIYKCAEPM
jgi:hypothetical protein